MKLWSAMYIVVTIVNNTRVNWIIEAETEEEAYQKAMTSEGKKISALMTKQYGDLEDIKFWSVEELKPGFLNEYVIHNPNASYLKHGEKLKI